MYHKLAGMTGTAETEASEFWSIYKLDVVVIPTNKPILRDDREDLIYKTKREKYNAVIDEIVRLVEAGRPVLVGTTSVEISELLSRMLKLRGIKHNVLNAKQHQLEAQIVAEAGRTGQVTIATNMAGRGTDIKLTPEVKAAGGLAIIGTERHESRRVDRQLRGRAGRQGDPGSSQFFVSLEDDLMRLFGSGRIAYVDGPHGPQRGRGDSGRHDDQGDRTRAEEGRGEQLRHPQTLLEYDDVMNSQREVIYTRRRHALYGERIEIDLNNIMYDFARSVPASARRRRVRRSHLRNDPRSGHPTHVRCRDLRQGQARRTGGADRRRSESRLRTPCQAHRRYGAPRHGTHLRRPQGSARQQHLLPDHGRAPGLQRSGQPACAARRRTAPKSSASSRRW